MRPLRNAVALASLLAAGLVACQLIVGVKDDDGVPRPTEAGSVDAGSDARDAQPTCPLRKPPGPPTADSPDASAEDGVTTTYFAVERLLIKPDAGGVELLLGYDLDDHCTGLPTTPDGPSTASAPSCMTPGGGTPVSDMDGGVDNAIQGVFDAISFRTDAASEDPAANFFNDDIGAGKRTFLVALRNYNGAANDTKVQVALLASEGLAGDASPTWNGADIWTHTEIFAGAGPALPLDGYVRDGTLVTSPPRDILLSFGGLSFTLHLARLVATFDPASPKRLVGGTLSGRVDANELIAASGQITVNDLPCQLPNIQPARQKICDARDLVGIEGGSLCSAISVGFGFTAVVATIGTVRAAVVQTCGTAPTCDP